MNIDYRMNGEILGLSFPVMIGMMSHAVIQIVDTAMVGKLGLVPLAGSPLDRAARRAPRMSRPFP